MTDASSSGRDPRRVAMGVSLGVSFVMLVGKTAAYLVTDSAAVFSDAAESVIHLLATGLVTAGLWYAIQPADTGHPYGHGKIAYLTSGFEGGLILIAALTIVYTAVRDLLVGPTLGRLDVGLWLLVGLSVVNLLLGRYLIRTGRRHNNLVLVSNGRHVMTDVWTSVGVVAGLGLVWLTGLAWLDPVVAILVAGNILWTAARLLRQAFEGLMERADAAATADLLATLDAAVQDGRILSYHQVRHRRIHDQVWVEYHLQFPGRLSLDEAHARSHEVEDDVCACFPDDEVFVTAHLEPDAHDDAHPHGHAEPADPLGGHLA